MQGRQTVNGRGTVSLFSDRSRTAIIRKPTAKNGGECVEVADVPGVSAVRNTENRSHGEPVFPSTEWRTPIEAVKRDVL